MKSNKLAAHCRSFKDLKNIIVISGMIFLLNACNSGGNLITLNVTQVTGSNGTIATPSACTNMVTGSTCSIQLTFNNNNTPSIYLTYTPTPLPTPFIINASFNNGIAACQSAINSSAGTTNTCTVTIIYSEPNPGAANSQTANLVFNLSGSTSGITVSGD